LYIDGESILAMRFRVIRILRALLLCVLAACTPGKPAATPMPVLKPVIVTLTFDDGDADNFAILPVLQQYGLHATFYIPSGLTGKPNYMTWDQLKALQAAGNEIGGHSLDHMKLGGLGTAQLQHEICDDRQNLVDHGLSPLSFAYPFGNYDGNTKAMIQQCGYAGARTIAGGPQRFPLPDPFAVRAMPYVVSDTDLAKIQRYVTGSRSEGAGWVVLIFHHVCDSCDYYAVRPDILNQLIHWLARQQTLGNVNVETFGEALRAAK
jgi:peptidoglycan/xylan/chitin deacetylase (PgdA/CDA1 family)